MASSIKIRDITKSKLEKLQAKLLLNYGKKISQQDLIDILINMGEKNPDQLLTLECITSEKIERILSLSKPWNIETDPDMLDNILVGEN
jgi:hypothetical protein